MYLPVITLPPCNQPSYLSVCVSVCLYVSLSVGSFKFNGKHRVELPTSPFYGKS